VRTLSGTAALTGARVSELCGLRWADARLDDLGDAEIEFAVQVDRRGNLAPTKTAGSARTIPGSARAGGYCSPRTSYARR